MKLCVFKLHHAMKIFGGVDLQLPTCLTSTLDPDERTTSCPGWWWVAGAHSEGGTVFVDGPDPKQKRSVSYYVSNPLSTQGVYYTLA